MPAQAFFAKWDDEGTVDLKDELSELIILTASRTLMGECHLL
jgi:sterol 14alpha-demethylase